VYLIEAAWLELYAIFPRERPGIGQRRATMPALPVVPRIPFGIEKAQHSGRELLDREVLVEDLLWSLPLGHCPGHKPEILVSSKRLAEWVLFAERCAATADHCRGVAMICDLQDAPQLALLTAAPA